MNFDLYFGVIGVYVQRSGTATIQCP